MEDRRCSAQPGIKLAMKKSTRELEVFSLSFLDVMVCAFGAVVSLIMLAKPEEVLLANDTSRTIELLMHVAASRETVQQMIMDISDTRRQAQNIQEQTDDQEQQAGKEQAVLADIELQLHEVEQKMRGVTQKIEKRKEEQRAAVQVQVEPVLVRDDEVGGIPVGSEYVVFIIDTSGSMKYIWQQVILQVDAVIRSHPHIQGFQILNDMGDHLLPGYKNRFIPDMPGLRANALNLLRNWNSFSNSSPVEGLDVALKKYVRPHPDRKVSIYIFGDDYTGNNYDAVIDMTSRNIGQTGEPMAEIHAIGFTSDSFNIMSLSFSEYPNRFAILMREVAKRNKGTFIALPP